MIEIAGAYVAIRAGATGEVPIQLLPHELVQRYRKLSIVYGRSEGRKTVSTHLANGGVAAKERAYGEHPRTSARGSGTSAA
jgi:hypothetical protein